MEDKKMEKWREEFYDWAAEKYDLDFTYDSGSEQEVAYLAARERAQEEINQWKEVFERQCDDVKNLEKKIQRLESLSRASQEEIEMYKGAFITADERVQRLQDKLSAIEKEKRLIEESGHTFINIESYQSLEKENAELREMEREINALFVKEYRDYQGEIKALKNLLSEAKPWVEYGCEFHNTDVIEDELLKREWIKKVEDLK